MSDPEDAGGTVEFFFRPDKVVVAPDGTSVYAQTGNGGNSLAVFERDPATGRISYLETERNGVDDPGDAGGPVTGIAWGEALAIAPDGGAVYAASSTESKLAVFERDEKTGELSFVEAEQDGVADGGPTVDGISAPTAIAASPDGDFVYVTGRSDDAVAMFKRNSGTETASTDSERNNVDDPSDPGGVAFARDTGTNQLAFLETEEEGVDDPSDPGGTVEGIEGLDDVVITPDGAHLYFAAYEELVRFDRDAATGRLSFAGPTPAGISELTRLELSVDGRQLYAGAGRADRCHGPGDLARRPQPLPGLRNRPRPRGLRPRGRAGGPRPRADRRSRTRHGADRRPGQGRPEAAPAGQQGHRQDHPEGGREGERPRLGQGQGREALLQAEEAETVARRRQGSDPEAEAGDRQAAQADPRRPAAGTQGDGAGDRPHRRPGRQPAQEGADGAPYLQEQELSEGGLGAWL